jgi:hypothetical protein
VSLWDVATGELHPTGLPIDAVDVASSPGEDGQLV